MLTKWISIGNLQTNNGQIKGLPKNPRSIKDERFRKLVQSIKDDPEMMKLRECIVYPQNGHYVVVAGNMRFRALKELKEKKVPCKILDAKTPVKKLRAIAIKDNVSFGVEDWDLLANEWDEIELEGWGVDLPADFNNEEIEEGVSEKIKRECQKKYKVKKGDSFRIGDHVLHCKSSIGCVEKSDLVFTDPPHEIECDFIKTIERFNDTNILILWSDYRVGELVRATTMLLRRVYAIDTGVAMPSRSDCHCNHLCLLRFVNGKNNIKFQNIHDGGRSLCSMKYRHNNPDIEYHAHAKPIDIVERFIQYWSIQNSIVLDMFAGSGSCMIACQKTKRKNISYEIDPSNCAVILYRMEQLFNLKGKAL